MVLYLSGITSFLSLSHPLTFHFISSPVDLGVLFPRNCFYHTYKIRIANGLMSTRGDQNFDSSI